MDLVVNVNIQLSEGFYSVVQMNPGQVCNKIGLCQFAADARYLANFLTLLYLLLVYHDLRYLCA